MQELPEEFLKDIYLKYCGWCLNDKVWHHITSSVYISCMAQSYKFVDRTPLFVWHPYKPS